MDLDQKDIPENSPHTPTDTAHNPEATLYGLGQPRWRDVGPALLYMLHLAGSFSLTGYCVMQEWHKGPVILKGLITELDLYYVLVHISMAMIISILGTVVLLAWARISPLGVIKGTYRLISVVLIIECLYLGVRQFWIGSVLFGATALLVISLYILAESKIPLSAAMLELVMDCTRTYRSLLWIGYLAGFVSVIYFLGVAVGAVALIHLVRCGSLSAYWLIGFGLSVFWTQQVFSNTVHATISGVVATNYFSGNRKVSCATLRFLGRILTYNFGSVCLGSLGVFLIQMMESVARRHSEHDMIGSILLSVPLRLLRNLMNYFNKYAFVTVALYGKSYFVASRETWKMLKKRGLDRVVNDLLIGQVTLLLPLLLGLSAFLISSLLSHIVYTKTLLQAASTALLVFFLSVLFPLMAFRVVDSGSTATFVCLAEDPERLRQNRPDVYEILVSRFYVLDEPSPDAV